MPQYPRRLNETSRASQYPGEFYDYLEPISLAEIVSVLIEIPKRREVVLLSSISSPSKLLCTESIINEVRWNREVHVFLYFIPALSHHLPGYEYALSIQCGRPCPEPRWKIGIEGNLASFRDPTYRRRSPTHSSSTSYDHE